MANELLNLIEMRKVYEKQEKILKDFFKSAMENDGINAARVGEIMLILSERYTTSIDRKMLSERLGTEYAKEFEKETVYKILDVKQIFG